MTSFRDSEITPKGRILRTPNDPRTPRRAFRVPDELYNAAQAAARQRGESLSDVVRRALRDYVAATTIE